MLPNGATVLTLSTPGTGVVTILTHVKAGYFNEPDEVAGMAHLFEHMFFKGSKGYPTPEGLDNELGALGGQDNAGTIYDSTTYHFTLPKEGFERAAALHADALARPEFDPKELAKEAEVVIEESNRKYDNPPAVATERMYATAFTKHRMKRWRIGSNEVLRGIKRDNLVAFFDTLYRPSNFVVVIAGDVTHEEALRVVTKTFGAIPKGTVDKKRGPAEPPQTEMRFGASSADLRAGWSVYGWQTPGVGHADEDALGVVAAILGGGRSSRLFRAVVGPQGASQVEAGHSAYDDIGIFEVQASFEEARRAEVDKRVLTEVARLAAFGPTATELALARAQIEADLLRGLETSLSQAQYLGHFEARGGYDRIRESLLELASLTPERVREVARKYLVTEHLTVYHYQPKGAKVATREEVLALAREAAKAPESAPAADSAVLAPQAAFPPAGKGATELVEKLPNGATLLVIPRPGRTMMSLGVYFEGGRLHESSADAGIATLAARSARRGTAKRSAEELDRAVALLGADLAPVVGERNAGFALDLPVTRARDGIALLTELVETPAFPEDGVAEEKRLLLAAQKRALDSGTDRPLQLLYAGLFPGHPYGFPDEGLPGTLDALDAAKLKAFWARRAVSDGALVVVAGDVDAAAVKEALKGFLDRLPRRTVALSAVPAVVPPAARLETSEIRTRKQTAMVLAFPTASVSEPDYPALRLLQQVTSGLSGTFGKELRGKQSLAYTVRTEAPIRSLTGFFLAYLATDVSKEDAAKAALLKEIGRLTGDGIEDRAVARAKASFAGAARIRLQSTGAIAGERVRNHFLSLPADFTPRLIEKINALSSEDLRAVAKKYLAGDVYVFAALRGKG
ncbi:MAG: insulinase family protein [Acidobacteria bacterium]|nr:insulinase family protein [Acidobacteriota bacterium]